MPPLTGMPNEATDFVHGLQRHLFENAVNYYREHGRRIKKKKAKLPPLSSRPQTITTPLVSHPNLIDIDDILPAKNLHPMGWSARYDFKMGVFAEFRQDLETASRHYEDAYQTLIDMFHSSLGVGGFSGATGGDSLTPYSPRWLEARVLVDSISIKMCKLSLYSDSPLPALQQHQRHLTNFKCLPEFAGELSGSSAALSVPGLRNLAAVVPGNGSFEYWAWVSKQCRIFGELIEIAVSKVGLKVPYPPTAQTGAVITSNDGGLNSANVTVTSQVVQHAGHYYYLAAGCAEERWSRFKLLDELARMSPTFEDTPHVQQELQSLSAERTIDHATLTIELLTKSYEQFKRHKSGRMTLFLAAEIARVYESSGKCDMALRFFERISKTYRKENWPSVLGTLLALSVACAKRLGRWNHVVECLVEMTSAHITPEESARRAIWEELVAVLKGGPRRGLVVVDKLSVNIDMDRMNAFLVCGVQFLKAHAYVRDPVHFQVTFGGGTGGAGVPDAFRLSRVRVCFSNGRMDNIWVDSGFAGQQGDGKLRFVDCTKATREVDHDAKASGTPVLEGNKDKRIYSSKADLQILPGIKTVFEGQILPLASEDLKIAAVLAYLDYEEGELCLNYKIGERQEDNGLRRKWLLNEPKPRFASLDGHGELSTVRVMERQPKIAVSLVHNPPILLDEVHLVTVEIMNNEDDEIEGNIDVDFKNSMSIDAFDKTSYISQDATYLLTIGAEGTPMGSSGSSSASINLFEEGGISQTSDNKIPATNPSSTSPVIAHGISGISIGTIQAKSKAGVQVYIRALKQATDRTFHVTVNFNTHQLHEKTDQDDEAAQDKPTENVFRFKKLEAIKIPCVRPFETSFVPQPRAIPMFFQELLQQPTGGLSSAEGGNRWLMEGGLLSAAVSGVKLERRTGWTVTGSVRAHAPCDVVIQSAQFLNMVDTSRSAKADVKAVGFGANDTPVHMKSGDGQNYVLHVNVTSDALETTSGLSLGALKIEWKRADTDRWCQSLIKVPALDLSFPDVWAYTDLPGEARVGVPFCLTYRLQNASTSLLEVNMIVEPSETFVFTGPKILQNVRVLPLSERSLRFLVVPLAAGASRLPKVKMSRQVVAVVESGELGAGLVDEAIPVYLAGGGTADEFVVYVWPTASR
ncbi:Gryzun, putative trafficking through golgi-domain-containing protein [Chytriomyces sp. MP71]|nr:Gryzun, putative trafficking through golgi-domain-containing protein [Chytriomyces sp. MP71]